MTSSKILKSNSLIYTTSKTINNEKLVVKIKLNDDCKNGHQDFSVTGDLYLIDKNLNTHLITCGAIHKEILEYFPEFKIFVDLHLCDYSGAPLHCVDNMFYHINNVDKKTFQNYYNCISDSNYEVLLQSADVYHFSYLLVTQEIIFKWFEKATTAILYLQELTNTEFINDSVRSNYSNLYSNKFTDIKKLVEEGYYKPEK